MCLEEYKKMWNAHLRPWTGLPQFPRDVSSRDTLTTITNGVEKPTPLNRSTVINEKQYVQSLSGIYKKKDCYVSVFSDWQIENRIFDTLFFELADAHPSNGKYYETLEEAMSEIMFGKHMLEKKLDKLEITYRCFFTGGRGFHYYLDFEPSFIKDYKCTLIKFLTDHKLIDLVDTAVFDSARLARLPYTLHLKTGKFAVYSKKNLSIDDLLEASKNNTILIEVPSTLKSSNILDYLDLDIEAPKNGSNDTTYGKGHDSWYPECVIAIIEKILIDQHATHLERMHLAGYLKRFGLVDREIVEYFRGTSDFNYDVALSQIESLDRYSNYSCRNVRILFKKLCPGMCEYIRTVARRKSP